MAMESLQDAMRPVLLQMNAAGIGKAPHIDAARGDSVLEERFWSLIDDTVCGRENSLDQFEIGSYRVDSIFLVPQRGAVIIELDGEGFHQDRSADYRRDMKLLKSVRGIIRIRYADLMHRPQSTFYTIGTYYPRFRMKGISQPHDDPRTADTLGITWYHNPGGTDHGIIRRIEKGQRNA